MITKKSILFFVFILMNFSVLSTAQEVWHSQCDENANFTINGAYQRNLNNALSLIISDTGITYGFYNSSVGETPDQVHVIALCRGDVEQDDCHRCVNDNNIQLRGLCPNQKNAIGVYESCMVRYSDAVILGKSNIDGWDMSDPENASNMEQFKQVLDLLWSKLRTEASSGGSLRKYASNSTEGLWSTTIFGLVQCTPDLSESQCFDCLTDAISRIQRCCDGKIGARVIYASCNIRYEVHDFFNDTVVLASQPPPLPTSPPLLLPSSGESNYTMIIVIAVFATISVAILVAVSISLWKRRERRLEGRPQTDLVYEGVSTYTFSIAKSLQYSFDVIRAATNNFSESNKLGQGGFGLVFKGKLLNDKEIAVKRLSRDSRQGELEFKNEVLLLAKLQHRNLVRLVGFILEGPERLLMYEFVQNASLDKFIFDPLKRATLDWERRYKIIHGVARGLVYLHVDSRLMIIHRDLKASNVLLDADMNAKIADFGMARLFEPEETHGNTSRIVGTYGYMAPEYVMHGQFSVKSDVFSFGVLVLETVMGQKHHSFENGMVKDLLGNVWKSWRDGTISSLIDPILNDGSNSLQDMIRCIHIGLLCVQEKETERPTMTSVILMLSSLSITLTVPSEPAFFMHTSTSRSKNKSKTSQRSISYDISISTDIYNR